MPAYVCGFAFDNDDNVALIRKARPDWQAGSLNGIGGHIEEGEPSAIAMVREFEEETGLFVDGWQCFVTLHGVGWMCDFYRVMGIDLTLCKTMTDEEVIVVPALELPNDVLWNLRWLIPLALDDQPSTGTLVSYG